MIKSITLYVFNFFTNKKVLTLLCTKTKLQIKQSCTPNYLRINQQNLRAHLYYGLLESLSNNYTNKSQ
jgi:hypothetical protein